MNTLTTQPARTLADFVRPDFPLLAQPHALSYLDNASTTLKPQSVIDAVTVYNTEYSVNVHRGIYTLSEQTTEQYEAVREQVRAFINAASMQEIIFTSGTTHALNLAARLLAQRLQAGDEVILSRLEHHANLIPWQIIAKEKQLELKFLETNEDDQIDAAQLDSLITKKTKVLAITHISNVSGAVVPIKKLIARAHANNMLVIVDAAQSVPHMPVDVHDLDCDMLAFSAHKMCGPTGVGVLYGKKSLLESLEPVFGGGSMIQEVALTTSTWAELPLKFEPGTPNIAGVVGFGAALAYLQNIGMERIRDSVHAVYEYALDKLSDIPGVTIWGPTDRSVRSSIISFTIKSVHAHDVATILNEHGVAVRAGHHCAQPLLNKWCIPATTRASFYFYNTTEDVDRLVEAVLDVQKIFAVKS